MSEKTTYHTAEDGLNVLSYLGITNITGKEKEVFREKWDEFYKNENQKNNVPPHLLRCGLQGHLFLGCSEIKSSKLRPHCQEPCAKTYSVLGFLSTIKNAKIQRAFLKSKECGFNFGHNDFVRAIWELYAEALPFICGDGDRNSFMVAQLRDSDFGKRLETTELDEDLKKGLSLEDIFKKGQHKFLIKVKTG